MPIDEIDPTQQVLPDRSPYETQATLDPTFSQTLKATFQNDNLMTNLIQTGASMFAAGKEPADPNFDLWDFVKKNGMEGYANSFIGAENNQQAQETLDKINQEQENKAVIASSGWAGVAASAASGLLDPMMLIPFGEAYNTYRTGGRILEGAGRTALITGSAVAGEEAGLQMLQDTRTPEESGANIATATLMGGILGGAAGALAKDGALNPLKDFKGATKRFENNINLNAPEFQDFDFKSAGAAANPAATTLEDQRIAPTIGLKEFKEPVLGWMRDKNMPQFTQDIAAKFLRNADEMLAFQDPVARMNNSPSKATVDLNEMLNETPLARNKNANFVASDIPVENAVKAWNLPKVMAYQEFDKQFLKYRNATSKVKTGVQDAINGIQEKVFGTARPDGTLTHHEFGEQVIEALHNGDQHAIPEVAATARGIRKYIFDSHFDEAHNVGLVDDETYKAAKEKNYAPFMYDKRAIENNRPDATNKIHQWLMQKRDAAAGRVKAALDNLGVPEGDAGTLFKQSQDELSQAQRDTKNMAKRADMADNAVSNREASIGTLKERLADAERNQKRIYEKILGGRDRGDDDLGKLFDEFRSQSSLKKDLYRQLEARQGEHEKFTALAEKRKAILDELMAKEEALSKHVDNFEAQLKDITLDEYKANFQDEDLAHVAYQIVDRILGTSVGRLNYDNKLPGISGANLVAGKRGSLKARKFDIPYSMFKDYIVKDLGSTIEAYSRSMAPDIELYRKFGTLDPENALKQIQDSYEAMAEGVKDPMAAKKLDKLKNSDLRDFKGTWERIRGTYGHNGADDYAKWRVAERVALNLNYLSALGGMTISAFGDLARPIMVHGITNVYGDGLKGLFSNPAIFKEAAKEIPETGTALDMVLHTTARARTGFDENVPFANRVEAITGAMAHNFGMLSLMAPWNQVMKEFSGVVTQSRMMRLVSKFAEGGSLTKAEQSFLAENYINASTAKKIHAQFKQFGREEGGVIVPNARAWTDADAQRAFRAGIRREVDKIIVTPGQDKPFLMSKSGWKLMFQFKSFSFAGTQRTMLTALQQKDMAVLNGTALTIGLGAMIYAIKSYQAGVEPDLSLPRLIVEGMDRGGLTGWLMDANNIAEKVTRGRVGVHAVLGGPLMSRYASRSAAEAILGPTYGKLINGLEVTADAFAGDLKPADVRMMRRMMPYQNLIIIRNLFDEAEDHINSMLPPPPQKEKQK